MHMGVDYEGGEIIKGGYMHAIELEEEHRVLSLRTSQAADLGTPVTGLGPKLIFFMQVVLCNYQNKEGWTKYLLDSRFRHSSICVQVSSARFHIADLNFHIVSQHSLGIMHAL